MRYRRLDANGDMTFGQGLGNFWINQPEAVAQSVLTRLRLNLGEWFYDTSDGTPWNTEVLGERTQSTRDVVVQDRVQTTTGVVEIISYGSLFDPNTRTWTAAMTLQTVYGPVALVATKLPGIVPPLPGAAPAGAAMAASGLGIQGGTPLTMVPADLTQGPRSDITDFEIQTLNAGSW
jgi:hypothetical protein